MLGRRFYGLMSDFALTEGTDCKMAILGQGVDFSGARPTVTVLKNAVKVFVIRYLAPQNSATQWKLLTKPEADMYRAAGIGVVSNFEWYASRCLEGYAAGVADAKVALAWHRACGGPEGRPIYFSVDVDTSGPSVLSYFQGVNSVLGVALTGVYGSYRVVKYLMDSGVIGRSSDGVHYWAWQTYAWSYGAFDERSALAQDKNGVWLSGYEVDLDSAHADDYGQWDYEGVDMATVEEIKALAAETKSAVGWLQMAMGWEEAEKVKWLKTVLVNIQGQIDRLNQRFESVYTRLDALNAQNGDLVVEVGETKQAALALQTKLDTAQGTLADIKVLVEGVSAGATADEVLVEIARRLAA